MCWLIEKILSNQIVIDQRIIYYVKNNWFANHLLSEVSFDQ